MRSLAGALALALISVACSSSRSDPAPTTPPPAPTSTLSPVVTDRLLAELDLELLAGPVSNLRGLEFLEPVPVQIIDDGDYRERVDQLAAAPLDIDVDRQGSWLRLLGLLPEGDDIYAATGRLLQTTVAIYDAPQNRILVRAGAGVDLFVESVVVHELVHALQIQHFGTPGTVPLDGDLGYVYKAIIEGDADRITRRFLEGLGRQENGRYEEGRLAAAEDATAVRAATPRFVLDGLTQPTMDGRAFLADADNATVDAYLADLESLASLPPTSEEFVVEGADLEPRAVTLRPPTLPGYEALPIEGTLGAGRLRLMLQQAVTGELLGRAIIGWGADELAIRVAGDDLVAAYAYRGETDEDAQELAAAFRLLLDTSLRDNAYASVRVMEDQVLVLTATDPSTQERLDELYGSFGEEVFFVELG